MTGLPAMIEVDRLTKHYGAIEAVKAVSFAVEESEVFAFLGPNGAGKSTTIKMLATLLEPTSGTARVAGHDVRREQSKVREAIGVVFQDPTLDDRLTALENLQFQGMLYGMRAKEVQQRSMPLLELVGLATRAKSLVRTYSGGMKRRLELVRGLLHMPKVLFLDEPTVGLDPQSRSQMWQYVLQLREQEGVSVFMTTHYMEEAEAAGRIAIMDHGEIVALDSPEGLKRKVGEEIISLEAAGWPDDARWQEGLPIRVSGELPNLQIRCADASAVLPRISQAFGAKLRRVEIRRPTLDTVFLEITGREIRDEEVDSRDAMRAMHARMGGGHR
ncbi:MAG: ATP-binding cassette domain-containing protein [Thermaerobacter sp.]|nr:ATP-binding cassette domain-containing protein [Thermaerobacter sp.]